MRKDESIRDTEARVVDQRLTQEAFDNYRKKSMRMDPVSSTYIDPEDIPYGYAYSWVRYSFFGEPDPHRIAEAENKQWTKVPASRHPYLRSEGDKDYLYIKGTLLMERPAQYDAIDEEARFAKQIKNANLLAFMQAPLGQKDTARSYYLNNPQNISGMFPQHVLDATSFTRGIQSPSMKGFDQLNGFNNHFLSFAS